MNRKPVTWRVQFKVFLPFIIRVVEGIKLVSRLSRHTVIVSLLLRGKEEETSSQISADGRTHIYLR